MRSIVSAFLGSFLLGAILGCQQSNTVEKPAHPVPPPKNPTIGASGPAGAPPAGAPVQRRPGGKRSAQPPSQPQPPGS
jgi:hypothetical protein